MDRNIQYYNNSVEQIEEYKRLSEHYEKILCIDTVELCQELKSSTVLKIKEAIEYNNKGENYNFVPENINTPMWILLGSLFLMGISNQLLEVQIKKLKKRKAKEYEHTTKDKKT